MRRFSSWFRDNSEKSLQQSLPEAVDYKGRTDLHFAAKHNNFPESLLSQLSDHDVRFSLADTEGNTPLHYAAVHGDSEVVKRLVEKGAPIDVQNRDGKTPIYIAVENARVDVVSLLAGAADLSLAEKSRGYTPGHRAISSSKALALLEPLLQADLDLYATDHEKNTLFHLALEKGNKLGEDNRNAVITRLLDSVKHINDTIRNAAGETILGTASRNPDIPPEIFSVLLEKMPSIFYIMGKEQQWKWPLYYAYDQGSLENAKLLATKLSGIRPFWVYEAQFCELLQRALHHRRRNIVKALIEEGVDPDIHLSLPPKSRKSWDEERKPFFKAGDGPAHIAARAGDIELLRACVVNNPSIRDSLNARGKTPLHIAILQLDPEAVSMLYDNSRDLREVEQLWREQSQRICTISMLSLAAQFKSCDDLIKFCKNPREYEFSEAQQEVRARKNKNREIRRNTHGVFISGSGSKSVFTAGTSSLALK